MKQKTKERVASPNEIVFGTTTRAELKPCKCKKSVLLKAYNISSGKFRVFCGHCEEEGPEEDNLQQAIDAWNKRS